MEQIMKQHLIAATLAFSTSLWAQQSPAQAPGGQAANSPGTVATPSQLGELAEGEVRKVDKATRKITLKHGAIKTLDMPPMTMVFVVGDPAMLDKLKAGDKVRFRAENKDGKMTVTEIRAGN
jgi:Cu/Ag efflux protein CusF